MAINYYKSCRQHIIKGNTIAGHFRIKIWFDQLATSHEVTFIPDDLLFIYPDIQAMPPTIEVDSDRYIVLEAYQPIDMIQRELVEIKHFVGDVIRSSDLDVFFN